MRTISAVLGLALAASGAACAKESKDHSAAASADKPAEQFPMMTVDQVDKAVAANEATAVDCNGERTRKKLGVVPGAIVISDEELFGASELPADKTRQLVFYCADPG